MFMLVIKYLLPLEYKKIRNNPAEFFQTTITSVLKTRNEKRINTQLQEIKINLRDYYGANHSSNLEAKPALNSWKEKCQQSPIDSGGAWMLIEKTVSGKEQRQILEMIYQSSVVLNTFIN